MLAAIVRGVDSGAGFDEELYDGEAVRGDGEVQGCASVLGTGVEVGVRIEQRLDEGYAARADRDVERAVLFRSGGVRVGAGGEKEHDGVGVAALGGEPERGGPGVGRQVRRCFCVEEQAHEFDAPLGGGVVERGLAAAGFLGVDRETGAEEQRDGLGLTRGDGGMEGGLAVPTAGIGLGAGGQEEFEKGGVADSRSGQERSLAFLTGFVGIRTVAEEGAGGFEVALGAGFQQGCRARRILRSGKKKKKERGSQVW